MGLPTDSADAAVVERPRWGFARRWAGMLIAVILATIPLWRGDDSPLRIPMLPQLHSLGPWFQWLPALALLAAGAVLLASAEGTRRWGWWIVAAALGTAFLLDQHRLQPWAYQSAIYAVVFATMPTQRARRWLIPLAASVYLYSGLGKLDYQFAHTVGQDFLAAIDLPWLGNLADRFEHNTLAMIALSLPLSEAVIAIGLLFTRTRRIAGTLVIALHASLILMLGPWNLDHSDGVLLWNVLLILQAWFLFVRPRFEPPHSAEPEGKAPEPEGKIPSSTTATAASPASPGQRFAMVLVMIAILMPASERWGYWDHWTSWALYSPHTSRAMVELHRAALRRVPAEMHPFLSDADGDGWYRLD
ncbi:MAG: hypothetical protein ACF788_02490, partial [Novipirellula sp. JB048]